MQLLRILLLLAATSLPAAAQQVAGGVRGLPAAAPTRTTATVWGQVRSERSGIPIRHAVVELLAPNQQPIAAVTDSIGVYILTEVPTGRRLLRATHIDHAPNEAEMVIEGGGRHQLDFDLELRPLRLTPLTARSNARVGLSVAAALDTATVSQSDVGAVALRVLESTPGVAELGLAEAAAEVPGHEPVDPTDVLYVRGGAADLKLVLLNGAPVYAPFHVGGLINALDADVMRSAVLHTGGAPSRYDGGMSYVMDLETRSARANRMHMKLGADLLAGRALLEGPLGPTASGLVSARVVHGEGTRAWVGDPFPYAYADALSRLDMNFGADHLLTATGFWNREQITLDTVGAERQQATWGNRAGSARLRGRALNHDMLATVAAGQFRTTLPLGGVRPLMSEGTANRTRVGLDFERQAGPFRISWGGSFDRIIFEYRAFEQGASRDSVVDRSRADGDATGVYAEASYSPLRRLRLRAGLRADVFSTEPGLRLAPRAVATLLLTDRVALSLGGGRYRQYVRAPERSRVFLGDVADTLTVAEATHLVLGLSQDLGEGIRLGIDGHFKQFEGLHFAKAKRTESSGVDLWVRRNTGSVTGWLGYSLAWIWTVESEQPRPTQSFSGRHLVTAGAAGPIVGRGSFDVRVSYGAGLPYTAIPEPESAAVFDVGFKMLNAQTGSSNPDVGALPVEPQQPYVRVDAQVQRSWSGQWRDFDFVVTPYFKVINALNRRDAIFYHYNRDIGHAEPLGGLPVVPIVGLEWRF